jgi:hypothetical protein
MANSKFLLAITGSAMLSWSTCYAQAEDSIGSRVLLVKILEFSKKYPEHSREVIIYARKKDIPLAVDKNATDFDSRIASKNIYILPNYVSGFQLFNCSKYGSIVPPNNLASPDDTSSFDSIYQKIDKMPTNFYFSKKNKDGLYYKYGYSYAVLRVRKCPNMIPPTKNSLVPVKLRLVRCNESLKTENNFVISLLK